MFQVAVTTVGVILGVRSMVGTSTEEVMSAIQDGFTVDVAGLRTVADTWLPQLADTLSVGTAQLIDPGTLTRPGAGHLEGLSSALTAYVSFTKSIVLRGLFGELRINGTAEALRGIATVYARADGQE